MGMWVDENEKNLRNGGSGGGGVIGGSESLHNLLGRWKSFVFGTHPYSVCIQRSQKRSFCICLLAGRFLR